MKCLALPVFVAPGHPRARAEAAMRTSAAALPWSLPLCWEGIQVTAKTIMDMEKLLHDIQHRVNRPATWNGFSGDESSGDESSDGDPD